MYIFPKMLEWTGQEWPSKIHKMVAEKVLLSNPRYNTLEYLKGGAAIIASIPRGEIKTVTREDLFMKGIMFP
jgi:hypothetical protein